MTRRNTTEAGWLERGSSGATADFAVDGLVRPEDRFTDAPPWREAEATPADQSSDQLAEKRRLAGNADEARLDEMIEESFPASDPPSFQPKFL